jgi:hypothetical protein
MPVGKCLEAYTLQKKNCAQSILIGFQHWGGITSAGIDAARMLGRGRAENGECGALHAALLLAKKPETINRLRQTFREQAGSEQCREIRAHKRLSCVQCVELAATTLAQQECLPKL